MTQPPPIPSLGLDSHFPEKLFTVLACLALLGFSSWLLLTQPAVADESPNEQHHQLVKERLSQGESAITVTDIRAAYGAEGWVQVSSVEAPTIYVSPDASRVIVGTMYGLTDSGLEALVDPVLAERRSEVLSHLTLRSSINFEPETVEHIVYVFTDHRCPFCQRMHEEIQDYLDLGIEIRYLGFVSDEPDSQAVKDIASVWCSDNPEQAMTQLKAEGSVDEVPCMGSPTSDHADIAQYIGVNGTPAILTQDGTLLAGYRPAEDLKRELTERGAK